MSERSTLDEASAQAGEITCEGARQIRLAASKIGGLVGYLELHRALLQIAVEAELVARLLERNPPHRAPGSSCARGGDEDDGRCTEIVPAAESLPGTVTFRGQ